jgi:hypothetical protein
MEVAPLIVVAGMAAVAKMAAVIGKAAVAQVVAVIGKAAVAEVAPVVPGAAMVAQLKGQLTPMPSDWVFKASNIRGPLI